MKLSKRERVLILVFIIALAIYAGSKYVPTLNIFNLEALKTEYNLKSLEYNNMSQNILLKTKYEENAKALSEEINSLAVISNLQQEQLIVFLNSYFKNNNIDAYNLSFTDITVVPMNSIATQNEEMPKSSLDELIIDINETSQNDVDTSENTTDNNNQQTQAEQPQSTLSARSISVNIAFESTYNNLIKFIDAIQKNTVDISITNINTVVADSELLQCAMTLNFYEIPKPIGFEENNKEWMWNELSKSGKSNPFSNDAAWETIGTLGNKFDFFINLEPESSDLPTVLVGKTEDSTRSTYISENNNAVENVQFSFKKENNKYFYRYSSKNNSYPKNGDWTEFLPYEDKIKVRIYSGTRNSKTDSVGVNITVTNTSGLNVYFEIENDNTTNPRVTFKDAKSVIIIRK